MRRFASQLPVVSLVLILVPLLFIAIPQDRSSQARAESPDGGRSPGDKGTDPGVHRLSVPTRIAFQGFLMEMGEVVNDSVDIVVELFNLEEGGTNIWSESHQKVPVEQGVFKLQLGETQPLDPADFTGLLPLYLQLTVDEEVQAPRTQLLSTPFAIRAHDADVAEGVAPGVAVTSLNLLTDDVKIVAGQNVSVTQEGDSITIHAAGSGGADNDWIILGNNMVAGVQGNVAIGPGIPGTKLSVRADGQPSRTAIEVWDGNLVVGGVNIDAYIKLAARESGGSCTEESFYLQTVVDKGFAVTDGASTLFVVSSSCSPLGVGNVGIGTDDPQAKLHVSGGAGPVELVLEADTETGGGEGIHPVLTLSQDEGAVTGHLGFFGADLAVDNDLRLMRVHAGDTLSFVLDYENDNFDANGDLFIGGGPGEADATSEVLVIRPKAESANWYVGAQNEPDEADTDFFIGKSAAEDGVFHIQRDGNVGIGTDTPDYLLDVDGSARIDGTLIAGGFGTVFIDAAGLNTFNRPYLILKQNGFRQGWLGYPLSSNDLELTNELNGNLNLGTNNQHQVTIDPLGNVGITGDLAVSGAATVAGDMAVSGTATVDVLEITGGADLAEPFGVTATRTEITPGMVMAIDPTHPGQLRVADRPYDRTVAGVVSGAHGIHAGITLKQEDTIADGSVPVALSGRVYCMADATYGAISPGDLLTTSSTPGHAMRVVDYTRAHGAILGKAMSSLDEGRGEVLVLVTLH